MSITRARGGNVFCRGCIDAGTESATKKLLNGVRLGGLRSAFRRERVYQLRMFRSPNTAIARRAGMKRETPEFGPRTFD